MAHFILETVVIFLASFQSSWDAHSRGLSQLWVELPEISSLKKQPGKCALNKTSRVSFPVAVYSPLGFSREPNGFIGLCANILWTLVASIRLLISWQKTFHESRFALRIDLL